MPKAMERELKKKFGAKSAIPYKIMNARGFMHGNKETKKGERSDEKHESKIKGLGHDPNKPQPGIKKKKKKSFAEAMSY